MSLTTDIPMSRIDARIPLSVRETIDRAAAMQGRTRTDFLIAAALEKAEQVNRLCALRWKISEPLPPHCCRKKRKPRRPSLKSCHPSTRSGWKADESAFSSAACGNVA